MDAAAELLHVHNSLVQTNAQQAPSKALHATALVQAAYKDQTTFM